MKVEWVFYELQWFTKERKVESKIIFYESVKKVNYEKIYNLII